MASLYKSMFVRILICLEISFCLTSIMAMDLSTKRFCGHVLTESLALICDGEYETIVPSNNKRSGMKIASQMYQRRIKNEFSMQAKTKANKNSSFFEIFVTCGRSNFSHNRV